jgi:hypothetical protein
MVTAVAVAIKGARNAKGVYPTCTGDIKIIENNETYNKSAGPRGCQD